MRNENVLGMGIQISSTEDTILVKTRYWRKLRWARLSGGSEKQFHDALRVYEVQFNSLEMNYLRKWVKRPDLNDYWDRLLRESNP
jgi:hypothetical protein